MNIMILTNGTRGDIQPLIYLSEELLAAGFNVTMVSSDLYKDLISKRNINFKSIPVNLQDYMNSEEGKEWLKRTSRNPIKIISSLKKMLPEIAKDTQESYLDASKKSDLIITTVGAIGDLYISDRLNIPIVEVQLQPLYPTRDFPYPLIIFPNIKAINKYTYYLFEQLLWLMFKKEIVKWAKKTLKVNTRYKGGAFAAITTGSRLQKKEIRSLSKSKKSLLRLKRSRRKSVIPTLLQELRMHYKRKI